jgi:hypothetical protein
MERSISQTVADLTTSGKKMIKKFMETNKQLENSMRNNENNFFIYLHSKPPLQLNKWKFSNHVIEHFSVPKLDKVYSFRVDKTPKPKYMTKPFRRPKIDGDYFDKHIGIIEN